LSASKRNVQRAAPSGGSLQANMTNLASTSPVNFGDAPGQPLSDSAACNPPERKRRRTLRTVFLQHKTASATSWSVRFWPWLRSLRSRIRALVWVRAGALPVRISFSSSVRSSRVRSIGVCVPMSHRIPSQAKKRKILYNEVLSSQFSVLGSWFLVLGSQFSVLSSQFLVLGSRFSVLSSQFSVPGSRFSVLSSQFSVPGSWFLVLGSWFLVLGSWFLVLSS